MGDTLFNMGACHKALGRREEARAAFLRSAMVSSAALGPDHEATRGAVAELNSLGGGG